MKVLKSHWIKRAVRTLLHLALDIFSIFFSVFYISGSSWLYGILSDTGRMCIRSNYCKVRPKSVIEMVVLHVYSIRCTCIINMCQDYIYHKVTTRSGTALWHSGNTVWPIFYIFFLAFDFCRFCVVIRFFHPRHKGQWPPTLKDFHTRLYPLLFYPILILEKLFAFFNVECQTRELLVPFL